MKPYSFRHTFTAAFVLAALCAAMPASAQSDDPHAILAKGVKATGLTGSDVPAWHLKGTYTFYDIAKGKQTETGTFEEWYSAPGVWHRLYTEKKQTANEWSTTPVKQFKLKDNKLDLNRLDQHVAQLLVDPVFQAENYKPSVEMSLQAGTFSGLVLDCVVAANPSQAAGAINPDVLFPRLCFDVKDSTLRFITTSDTMTIFTDFRPMGSHQVATNVQVKPYNRLGTELHITDLEPLSAGDQAQLAPPSHAIEQPYAHKPGDTPLVPVKITECAYPMDARDAQEHGVVTIPVIIKKDGSVKSNGPAMGPQHLAMAAGDCVGNYKFEPFKIDGEPVDVSDSILYDFENKAFTPSVVTIASQPPPPPAKK